MEDPFFSVLLYNRMLEIVGCEEEIAMRRTEIDICDYLYNQMSCVAIHRRSAGSHREGLRMTGSDVDIMYYPTNHHVICDLADTHYYNPTTETIILMKYQETIPGTVFLRLLNMHPTNNTITKQSCVQRGSLSYLSSRKYLENADKLYFGQKVVKHGPCQTNTVAGNEYDGAVGFVGRKWPPQANDWVSRGMRFRWPEVKVLENIVFSGCHFVPIGSKQSRHENGPNLDYEWRISFVQAEQKLVYAMTHCQFLCYALLKVFLTEVLNKNVKEEDKLLCSYFLKTAVFWAIQTDPEFHWSKENFFSCFWKCFKLLLQWVYTGYCPNFFIPQNNLFVFKIVGADQEKLFTQMYDLYCAREQSLAQCSSLMKMMSKVLNNPNRLIHESTEVHFDEYDHDAVLQHTLVSINALQNQELDYDRKAFYNVTHMNTGSMSLTEKVLIKRHALNVYHQIAFKEQFSCSCEVKCKRNRQTYREHKTVGSRLLKLTSEFGCASDNLYLALFQYLDGKFKYSLNTLEVAKTRLYQTHVFYWNEYKNKKAYTREMLGKPMTEKMKEAMAFDIHIPLLTQFHELDVELSLLMKTRQRRALIISPFVFHMFLVFLCHYRVKSQLAARSLQELHTLVSNDCGQYIVSHTRDTAWEILGICHQLAGNLDQALQAYLTSLKQTPINFITEATKMRVLLLGSETDNN